MIKAAWPQFTAFQSTLPHGERPRFSSRYALDSIFQSTLPHGERPPGDGEGLRPTAISIHAPAWGATESTSTWTHRTLFQSTLPHGERHDGGNHHRPCTDFNPRSRMGSDKVRRTMTPSYAEISIHAPAWGATHGTFTGMNGYGISIHAPAWGATCPKGGADMEAK